MKPKNKYQVSVVLPVFNAEMYVEEAIQSVLSQTFSVFEIIVVDDGSTDESAKAINRHSDSLHYFHQENRGPAAAMNFGFNKATGNYIAVIAADDIWEPEKIARQIAEFENDPTLDMVFGHVKQFISPELDAESKRKIFCPPEAMPGYSAGSMLIKTNSHRRVGNFDDRWDVGEFIDWFSRSKDLGLKSKMLNNIVFRRRLHTSNLTVRKRGSYSDYAQIIKASLDRRRNLGKK